MGWPRRAGMVPRESADMNEARLAELTEEPGPKTSGRCPHIRSNNSELMNGNSYVTDIGVCPSR